MTRKTKAQKAKEAALAERIYRALIIVGWQPADADDATLVLAELGKVVDVLPDPPEPGDEEVVLDAFTDLGWQPDEDEIAYSPTTIRHALGLPEPEDVDTGKPTILARFRKWFGSAA